MRGYHEANQHKSTLISDEPKAVVLEKWSKAHPGCTIVQAIACNSSVEIIFTKDSEVEAARLENEKPDVCIGRAQDYSRDSLSIGSKGISY